LICQPEYKKPNPRNKENPSLHHPFHKTPRKHLWFFIYALDKTQLFVLLNRKDTREFTIIVPRTDIRKLASFIIFRTLISLVIII
jgi:hypothetical protein